LSADQIFTKQQLRPGTGLGVSLLTNHPGLEAADYYILEFWPGHPSFEKEGKFYIMHILVNETFVFLRVILCVPPDVTVGIFASLDLW
jgi:hypothetical protein